MNRPTSQSDVAGATELPVSQMPSELWMSQAGDVRVPLDMPGRQISAMETKAAAIRRAAYVCFTKHGYHGTTVDLVCAEAGISKGAFYWHYESKLAVFVAILDVWAEEVERELDHQFSGALQNVGDFAAALHRETHRVRAILPVWLEFLAQSGRNEEMRSVASRFHHRIREVITHLILPAVTPTYSEAEAKVLASALLGAIIGIVGQQLVDNDSDFDAHFEQVLAVVARAFSNKQA